MKSTGNFVLHHSLFTLETLSDINCLPERAVRRDVYYIQKGWQIVRNFWCL